MYTFVYYNIYYNIYYKMSIYMTGFHWVTRPDLTQLPDPIGPDPIRTRPSSGSGLDP